MGVEIKKINKKKPAFSGKESGGKFIDLNKDINFSFLKSKFSDKKKENFYSELSILLSSGLDISSAFKVIIDQEDKVSEREVIRKIYEDVLKGVPIYQAISKSQKFNDYDFFCVRIGEESGQLSEVLNELSFFYVRKIKYKRKFINALTYPILVLFTAAGAILFMLNFLVPMFVDVFKRTNSELPGITKFIINLSEATTSKLPFILIALTCICIFLYTNRKKELFRRRSAKIMIRLPIIGEIVKLVYIERFIISMVLLTKSQVSVVKAIGLIRNMISFYPLEKALECIEQNIIQGKLLYESMAAFPIFDKKLVSLVKVGEEVNQLGAIFEKLNKQYSEELDYKINNVSNLLEPILIIFIGLIVGVILIAMYLPIFQIGNSIG